MDKNFGIMMEEIEIEFVIKHLQKKRDGQTKMLEWGIGGSTLLFLFFDCIKLSVIIKDLF